MQQLCKEGLGTWLPAPPPLGDGANTMLLLPGPAHRDQITIFPALPLQRLLTVPKLSCALCFSATAHSAGQTFTVNAFLEEMEMVVEAIGYMDFNWYVKPQDAK